MTSGPNPVVSLQVLHRNRYVILFHAKVPLQKDFTARATAISLMRRGRARTPPDREENISREFLQQLRDAYQRSRAQKRGGDNYRRRLKGLCCGLLNFFIQVRTQILDQGPLSTDRSTKIYRRRLESAQDRLRQLEKGCPPIHLQEALEQLCA